jgi:hypothetical protein
MKRVKLPAWIWVREAWRELPQFIAVMREITLRRPDMRRAAWGVVLQCALRNPTAIRSAVTMIVFYLFLAPLSRFWSSAVKLEIEAIEAGGWEEPDRPSVPASVSVPA